MEEYKRLYKLYLQKSDSELEEIMKPENGYSPTAIKVASDVLKFERADCEKVIKAQGGFIEIPPIDENERTTTHKSTQSYNNVNFIFCANCGASNKNNSKFCFNCGHAIDTLPTKQYSVTIQLENQFFAVNPVMNVSIDNNYLYEIEKEEPITISLSGGNHIIEFSYGIRNKSININVTQNLSFNIKFDRLTGGIEIQQNVIKNFCTQCGNELDNNIKFCPNCGTKTTEPIIESDLTNQQTFCNVNNNVIQKAPHNSMSILGLVISIISLFINFWGAVGMAGLILSILGLLQIDKTKENGKALSVIGIIIGVFSVFYAFISLANI